MKNVFRYIVLVLFIFTWCNADAHILRFDVNAPPLSVQFDQVATGQINLEFTINELSLNPVQIANKTYMQPEISGEPRLLQKGNPDLPVLARALEIPSEGEVSFQYQVLEYEDIQNCFVAPSKGHISRAQNTSDIPYSFGTIYNSTEAWPKNAITVSEPYLIRSCRGVTVRLCPFQYFPATGTLRVFQRVSVQVYCKSASNVSRLSSSQANVSDPVAFQDIYASRFINYHSTESKRSTRSQSNTSQTRPGSMLIITTDQLAAAVEPLATWKRQMGIPTDVVLLSEIGSTADEVKAYVQSVYDTGTLAWLLLVGDSEEMPYLMVDYGSEKGASDPSYGKLAGSDDYPDIFVGRFSGSTPQQIATMVERTIHYEQSPETGASWYTIATGVASEDSDGDNVKDFEHMDILRTQLLSNGYEAMDRIYDPGATALQLAEAVNEGRGLINYLGHGDVQEWVTTGFTNDDVNVLTNTAAWPFIFDVACLNGQFVENLCFAEAWIQAEHEEAPAGALAIYASTIEQDWVPPMTAQDEFNRLLIAGNITEYGALCFSASMKMMDDWTESGLGMFNTWTVFGDPSVQIRTKQPTTLSVTCPEQITSLSYPVHVADVEGALAGLSAGGEYLGSAYTDADGNAVIKLDSLMLPKMLQLTVTAFNAVPYTSTVIYSEAELSCSPTSVAEKIPQGQSASRTLIVSNAGPDSSTLEYSIRVLPDFSKTNNRTMTSTYATRSVSGCTLAVNVSEYTPGERAELTVTLKNNSPDAEYISEVEMKFPETVTVKNVTKLEEDTWGLTPDGSTGAGATVIWQAEDIECDSISEKATGTVTLAFSTSAGGPLEIGWTLKGDSYGDEPHQVTGVITLEERVPRLAINTPNGGESWLIGSTQEVEWTSSSYTGPVTIECSVDGGISWQSIEEGVTNSGQYAWDINLAQQSDECLLRITATDDSVSATSDAPFNIYNTLDWLTITNASGVITGNGTDAVTLEFDASGKNTGIYQAILEVSSYVGSSYIPVEMTVLPTGWTISSKDGDIAPNDCPDGYLTIQDVVFALQCAVNSREPVAWQLAHGDVAPLQTTGTPSEWEPLGDGRISIGDVVVLLRASVGLVAWEGMAPLQ